MKRRRWDRSQCAGGCPSGLRPDRASAAPPAGGDPIRQGFEAAWARQPEQRAAALRRDAAVAGQRAAQRWTPEPPALELTAKSDARRTTPARANTKPRSPCRCGCRANARVHWQPPRPNPMRWKRGCSQRDGGWRRRFATPTGRYQRARLERSLAQQRLDQRAAAGCRCRPARQGGRPGTRRQPPGGGAVAAAESAVAEAAVALSQAAQRWTSLTGTAAPAGEDARVRSRPAGGGARCRASRAAGTGGPGRRRTATGSSSPARRHAPIPR